MRTIFSDVDGVILKQPESFLDLYKKVILNPFGDVITESRDKLFKWYTQGYRIILTTGRPEHEHEALSKHLMTNGVYYHKLIMDCGSGIRYLINDIKPSHPDVQGAVGINLIRNKGLGEVEV